MTATVESSDVALLDLLRSRGALGIGELATAMGVTATAIRQRLARLMRQELVQRKATRAARGRPGFRYSLTEKGQRQTGTNFADLTLALWTEIRKISDPAIRTGLLRRVALTLADQYAPQMHGVTASERLREISGLLAQRDVPVKFEDDGRLPVLTALACPYPELAQQDRGICAVEKMLFSELVGTNVRLADCRLDGATCCRFEAG